MLGIQCLKIRHAIRPFTVQKRMKSAVSRNWFQYLFHENLLLTNSLTSGLFMAIGDLVIQEIEFRNGLIPERYNWARATRMLIVGGLMGPLHHYYYIKLDQLIPKVNLKTVFVKIAADQFFCAPLTILFFFYGMGVLENKSMQKISEEIKQKFMLVYMGDCMFWPPVQFINFYYLPTAYRVVYINLATVIFDVYLAYVKHYDYHADQTINETEIHEKLDSKKSQITISKESTESDKMDLSTKGTDSKSKDDFKENNITSETKEKDYSTISQNLTDKPRDSKDDATAMNVKKQNSENGTLKTNQKLPVSSKNDSAIIEESVKAPQ